MKQIDTRMLQLTKFLFFNSGLNFFDVATDLILFVQLEEEGHVFWAALTMLWMWSPFFSHLGFFIFKIPQAIYGEENCDLSCKTFYKEVFIHIPFVLPFQNAKRALTLYQLGYGSDGFEAKNASKVRSSSQMHISVKIEFNYIGGGNPEGGSRVKSV